MVYNQFIRPENIYAEKPVAFTGNSPPYVRPTNIYAGNPTASTNAIFPNNRAQALRLAVERRRNFFQPARYGYTHRGGMY